MLDIKFVRSNLEVVQEVLDARGMEVDLVGFAQYDEERRDILRDLGRLKHIRNLVSHQIGKMKKRGDDASEQIKKMREVSAQIKEMEAQVKVYEDKLERILGSIPNIPHSSVSFGPDDSGNIEIKRWGEIPEFGFPIQPHWDIGEALEILDFERGAKISGSRFPVSKHLGAKMERVLINFMLDIHIKEHGYTEVYPPLLAREECLFGTGQLPRFRDEMFSCKDEGLFLIPTSEVPLINIHRGEILKADQLPFYYVSCTPCFRKEAGSYGRDAKGLYRVHQFNMVELVKFVKPDDS
jgi:seryl-tRNA synthetase